MHTHQHTSNEYNHAVIAGRETILLQPQPSDDPNDPLVGYLPLALTWRAINNSNQGLFRTGRIIGR